MNRAQIGRFRRRLIDEIATLYRAVHGDVRGAMSPEQFDPGARDEGDEALRDQLRDLRLSLAESEARRAQLIEEALRRIARGEFGECVDCGNPIGLDRLRTVPWAARCIECQESVERAARGRAPRL